VNVGLTVNGAEVQLETRADEMLLAALRRELGILSVRETCSLGICGACTVLLDGEPVSACLLLAPLAAGRSVETVEALGGDHPVQRAFSEARAYQCGWCTPGMILTAKALLDETPRPTDEEIVSALSGNLCRCGSYVKILDAVRKAVTT
jgi:aerobic-type carbon monoxide dehydrogenase small subunit (CoxS/CutS family)